MGGEAGLFNLSASARCSLAGGSLVEHLLRRPALFVYVPVCSYCMCRERCQLLAWQGYCMQRAPPLMQMRRDKVEDVSDLSGSRFHRARCVLSSLALTSSNEACHQLRSGQSSASPETHVTPSMAIYLLQI